MVDPNTTTILIGFFTLIGGFFAIAKVMLKQASKDRDADRAERELLTKSIKKMASATEKVAKATERSAAEAKQRNGHLGEQSYKIAALVVNGNETNKEILSTLQQSAKTLAKDTHDAAMAVKAVKERLE